MKPLHVQVAEALGITTMYDDRLGHCYIPDSNTFALVPLPRYDTDWSALGPLIECFRIHLIPPAPEEHQYTHEMTQWGASSDELSEASMLSTKHAGTPLLAVCYLILALKAAGRLAA